jgi:type IX secretion system PorP/SprF family membrane protein
MKSARGKLVKCILLSWLLMFMGDVSAQQQPVYSQYMFNMLNINPAYAGSRGVLSMVSLYRGQWLGMPGAPKTTSVSLDMPINEKRIGVGVQLYDDRLGVERSTGLNASYAFRIQTSESGVLSLGLQAGILNYHANYAEVSTFQSSDPSFYQNINGILPTAGAGVYYNTDNFYIGASVPALLKTKLTSGNTADISSITGKELHIFIASGFVSEINEDLSLKPSVLIKGTSGAPIQIDLNANLWIKDMLSVGASYRTGDSYVGMIEWQINRQLRFGYAYDKTFSNLGLYNNGTHEIMLRLEFGQSESKSVSPRYF